jgi:hypothetical protein
MSGFCARCAHQRERRGAGSTSTPPLELQLEVKAEGKVLAVGGDAAGWLRTANEYFHAAGFRCSAAGVHNDRPAPGRSSSSTRRLLTATS